MAINWNSDIFKNISLNRAAFYLSLSVSLLFLIVLLGLYYYFKPSFSYLHIAVIILCLFAGLYYIIRNFLDFLVYRKIKVIYKMIHRTKQSDGSKSEKSSGNEPMFATIEDQIDEWNVRNETEIDDLRLLENYRKEFLGNVSHELKTPIFNIQGYLQTLMDGGLHDSNINSKYVERAMRNAERLETIVKDLEAISKLESGKLQMDIQKFDIKEIVVDVFEEIEVTALQKQIQLTFKEGADKGFMVSADKENIRLVVNNLISNAIKYNKPGGYVKASFYDMYNYILIEIADNGIGLSEHDAKHVFDRFYRADKSRSRSVGGSGLGLAIVKHIIEAHNQKIVVRSTLGEGSTFGFTLAKVQS